MNCSGPAPFKCGDLVSLCYVTCSPLGGTTLHLYDVHARLHEQYKLVLAQCLPACLSLSQAASPACLPLFFSIGVTDSRAFTRVNIETILAKYTERNIYNEGQVGMLYNLLLNYTLPLCHKCCFGRKASKEQFTVLFCTNMDGSNKRHLFATERLPRSCCFK